MLRISFFKFCVTSAIVYTFALKFPAVLGGCSEDLS